MQKEEAEKDCIALIAQLNDTMVKWRVKSDFITTDSEKEAKEIETFVKETLLRTTCLFSKWIIEDIRKIDEYEALTFNPTLHNRQERKEKTTTTDDNNNVNDNNSGAICISNVGHGVDGVDDRLRCYEAKTSEVKLKKGNNKKYGQCNFSWPIPSNKTRAHLLVSVFEKTGNQSLFSKRQQQQQQQQHEKDDYIDTFSRSIVPFKKEEEEEWTILEKARSLVALFVLSAPQKVSSDSFGMAVFRVKSKATGNVIEEFRFSCRFLIQFFFYLPLKKNKNKEDKTPPPASIASDFGGDDAMTMIDAWLSEKIANTSFNFGCEGCEKCGSFHRLQYLQALDKSTADLSEPMTNANDEITKQFFKPVSTSNNQCHHHHITTK